MTFTVCCLDHLSHFKRRRLKGKGIINVNTGNCCLASRYECDVRNCSLEMQLNYKSPGFRCIVDAVSALLGRYTAYVVYRCFGTLSVPMSVVSENGTDRLSRNVGKQLLTYAPQQLRKTKTSVIICQEGKTYYLGVSRAECRTVKDKRWSCPYSDLGRSLGLQQVKAPLISSLYMKVRDKSFESVNIWERA